LNLAPIVLFVYNRLWHTDQTVNALKKADLANKSDLYIFSDGPKPNENPINVFNVRDYIKNVYIIESDINRGLAKSIISGVNYIFSNHDRVIVLEDDLIVENRFLIYMNKLLDKLDGNPNVSAISGYSFYSNSFFPNYYGLKVMSSWGWGTWKNAWNEISFDANELQIKLLQKDLKKFNFSNFSYSNIFKSQLIGKVDSWAILYYANLFINNKVCIYPNISLVKNIGFDGSGTHLSKKSIWDEPINNKPIINHNFSTIKENYFLRILIEKHIKSKRSKNS
jgi:hypothetical protein